MAKQKTKVNRLVEFVKEAFDVELDENTFVRIRAGYFQRAMGAWSWSMRFAKDSASDFGSQESVSYILKNKHKAVLYNGNEIVIENYPPQKS